MLGQPLYTEHENLCSDIFHLKSSTVCGLTELRLLLWLTIGAGLATGQIGSIELKSRITIRWTEVPLVRVIRS